MKFRFTPNLANIGNPSGWLEWEDWNDYTGYARASFPDEFFANFRKWIVEHEKPAAPPDG